MTTHKLLGYTRDAVGPAAAYCSCGRWELLHDDETVRAAFERHRARCRGHTRRRKPK